MKNYYKILDLEKEATQEQISSSFKKLSKKHHPDIGGDAEKFKEISEAYNVLKDKNKKNEYDLKLNSFGSREYVVNFENSIFNEFFTNIFQNKNRENLNIHIEYLINIKDFFKGKKDKIKYKRLIKNNNKYSYSEEIVDFEVMSGTQDNKIIFNNLGNQSQINDKKFGYMAIIIRVVDNFPLFSKHGNDVVTVLPIPLNYALTGCEIDVPTLHGKRKIKINSNDCFSSNNKITIKNCGFRKGINSKEFGNAHIVFEVEIPSNISKEEMEFLKNIKVTSENYPKFSKIVKEETY